MRCGTPHPISAAAPLSKSPSDACSRYPYFGFKKYELAPLALENALVQEGLIGRAPTYIAVKLIIAHFLELHKAGARRRNMSTTNKVIGLSSSQ